MLPLSMAKGFPPSLNVFVAIVSGALGYALLELILKEDRHAALAAAFLLHLFITFSSLPNAGAFLSSGKIPWVWNVVIVVESYLYSLFKSYAMKFLPMSIFLTGSNMQLVVAVIIGKLLFSSVYTTGQITGVLLVVAGCTITALLSSDIDREVGNDSIAEVGVSDLFMGTVCMLLMLFSIAALMPTVSYVVRKYHADSDEQLFMQHSLALPLFALQWSNLLPSLNIFHREVENTGFSIYGQPIPLFFILLVASAVFTHINRTSSACITMRFGSLTSQLVATLTKTLSTLMSFFIFNCNITGYTSGLILLGIFLQTTGSVLYAVNTSTEKEKAS
jgi:hypothetical protein